MMRGGAGNVAPDEDIVGQDGDTLVIQMPRATRIRCPLCPTAWYQGPSARQTLQRHGIKNHGWNTKPNMHVFRYECRLCQQSWTTVQGESSNSAAKKAQEHCKKAHDAVKVVHKTWKCPQDRCKSVRTFKSLEALKRHTGRVHPSIGANPEAVRPCGDALSKSAQAKAEPDVKPEVKTESTDDCDSSQPATAIAVAESVLVEDQSIDMDPPNDIGSEPPLSGDDPPAGAEPQRVDQSIDMDPPNDTGTELPLSGDDPPAGAEPQRMTGSELPLSGMDGWLYDDTVFKIIVDLIIRRHNSIVCVNPGVAWEPDGVGDASRAGMTSIDVFPPTVAWTKCFVPIVHNMHWMLAVISRDSREIVYYDPLRKHTASGFIRDRLVWVWSLLHEGRQANIRLAYGHYGTTPVQSDSYNCGIFTCLYALAEVERSLPKFCTADLDHKRKEWFRAVTGQNTNAPRIETNTRKDQPKSLPLLDRLRQWNQSYGQWSVFEAICDEFTASNDEQETAPTVTSDTSRTCSTQTSSGPRKKGPHPSTHRVVPAQDMKGRPVGKTATFSKTTVISGENREARDALQSLYRKDRKKALSKILGKDNRKCEIDIATVTAHFEKVQSGGSVDMAELEAHMPDIPSVDASDLEHVADFITPAEVLRAARAMPNSAPGSDKLTYNQLIALDRSGMMLAEIYSVCIRDCRIPAKWKTSHTILLYKGGDDSDIGNWRPIAIMLSIYKLFTAILAKRLRSVATALKTPDEWRAYLTSVEQTGYEQCEGCSEHVFQLSTVINRAVRLKQDVSVAWLDLANAFGSVPHEFIVKMMNQLGMPLSLIHLVEDMYLGSTTAVVTADDRTPDIPIRSGVKQGDPLSPILFCIVMEYMLRAVKQQNSHGGVTIGDVQTLTLAFADDLAVVGSSPEDLQRSLDVLSEQANRCGLTFKPKKCASLTVARGTVHCRVHAVQGRDFPSLREGESYPYLGVPIGVGVDQTPTAILDAARGDADLIARSALGPWQKMDAIRTFVLSRLPYHLRHRQIRHNELVDFEKQLVRTVKLIHDLPSNATTHMLFTSIERGGLGLRPPLELYRSLQLARWYNLLHSERDQCRALMQALIREHCVTDESAVELFNAEGSASKLDPLFLNVRSCVRDLRRQGIPLSVTLIDGDITMTVGVEESALPPRKHRHLLRLLTIQLSTWHQQKWQSLVEQGLFARVYTGVKESNAFVRDSKYMSWSAYVFALRARTNTLPARALKRSAYVAGANANEKAEDNSRKCTLCKANVLETLGHILNGCKTQQGKSITWRHDAIQKCLVEAIRSYDSKLSIVTDARMTDAGRQMRPDIVVKDESERKAFIIDIACAYENGEADCFMRRRTEKVRKYEDERLALEQQGYAAIADAIVVGSLGTWDPDNNDLLREIGLSKGRQSTLRRRCVQAAVEGSKVVYYTHKMGDKYVLPLHVDAPTQHPSSQGVAPVAVADSVPDTQPSPPVPTSVRDTPPVPTSVRDTPPAPTSVRDTPPGPTSVRDTPPARRPKRACARNRNTSSSPPLPRRKRSGGGRRRGAPLAVADSVPDTQPSPPVPASVPDTPPAPCAARPKRARPRSSDSPSPPRQRRRRLRGGGRGEKEQDAAPTIVKHRRHASLPQPEGQCDEQCWEMSMAIVGWTMKDTFDVH